LQQFSSAIDWRGDLHPTIARYRGLRTQFAEGLKVTNGRLSALDLPSLRHLERPDDLSPAAIVAALIAINQELGAGVEAMGPVLQEAQTGSAGTLRNAMVGLLRTRISMLEGAAVRLRATRIALSEDDVRWYLLGLSIAGKQVERQLLDAHRLLSQGRRPDLAPLLPLADETQKLARTGIRQLEEELQALRLEAEAARSNGDESAARVATINAAEREDTAGLFLAYLRFANGVREVASATSEDTASRLVTALSDHLAKLRSSYAGTAQRQKDAIADAIRRGEPPSLPAPPPSASPAAPSP
jgi:hypothetical protein